MYRRIVISALFLLLGILAGLLTEAVVLSTLFGAAIGLYIYLLDRYLSRFSYRVLLGGSLGGIGGFLVGVVTVISLLQVISYFQAGALEFSGTVFLPLAICLLGTVYLGLYLGVTIVKKMGEEVRKRHQGERAISPKLLDTSVIIDGRIADIVEIGFLEGTFVVPKFIIKEMQNMADSGAKLKRERGRRGLDILNKMRTELSVEVFITDLDFPEIPEVDSKLVAAAQELDAKIVTNDFNLNKVARLENLEVLNINELSNAVKPVFIPGEEFEIEVIKEGEEEQQGVGYLEDGTMVVVEEGQDYVGKTITVTVTSVIQTSAGRMIFTQAGEVE